LAGVRVLTLNRPAALNAFNPPLYLATAAALTDAAADPSVHLLILAGAGRAFCAGMDVRSPGGGGGGAAAAAADPDFSASRTFMDALRTCPLPIVAAVHGPAVGIGTTLLLHVELVYAAADAEFWTPFAARGLAPEFGSSALFGRRLRRGVGAELLLLGRRLGAADAAAAGLVTAVLPAGGPRAAVAGGGGAAPPAASGDALLAAVVARLAGALAAVGVGPWLRTYKRLLVAGEAGGAGGVPAAMEREFGVLAARVGGGEAAAAAARLAAARGGRSKL